MECNWKTLQKTLTPLKQEDEWYNIVQLVTYKKRKKKKTQNNRETFQVFTLFAHTDFKKFHQAAVCMCVFTSASSSLSHCPIMQRFIYNKTFVFALFPNITHVLKNLAKRPI